MDQVQIWLRDGRAYYPAKDVTEELQLAVDTIAITAKGVPRYHPFLEGSLHAMALTVGSDGPGLWRDPEADEDQILEDIADAIDVLKPGRYPVYLDELVVDWFEVPNE